MQEICKTVLGFHHQQTKKKQLGIQFWLFIIDNADNFFGKSKYTLVKIVFSYTVYWNSRERMKTHKAVGKLSFGPDKVSKER